MIVQRWLQAVLLFQPKYWFAHPENYWILLFKRKSRSRYPKHILFESRSTDCRQWSFFLNLKKKKSGCFDPANIFLIIKINNFRGELSDVSAKTATLIAGRHNGWWGSMDDGWPWNRTFRDADHHRRGSVGFPAVDKPPCERWLQAVLFF